MPPLPSFTAALRFALVLLAVVTSSPAQVPPRPAPHLGFVYPAGAQQGTTVQITIGGQNLAGPVAAYFSLPGVEARVLGFERPMTQGEFNTAREQLQQLLDRRTAAQAKPAEGAEGGKPPPAFTAEDEARIKELRTRIANRPSRPPNPAISEIVTLEVTVPAGASPGEHELRLKCTAGLSNPFVFCVGQLPETTEPAVTAITPQPELVRLGAAGPGAVRAQPPRAITLPALVNGQVLQGEVDRWRFAGRKGQQVTVAVSARALIPFLADAVPGWFQPTLALHDAAGRELAYADDFRFNPDPVLAYQLPEDGDYTLAIKDAIYRGREDFVYRIAVGELPFITGVFPLGATASGKVPVELTGWNLPASRVDLDALGRPSGTFLLTVRKDSVLSNPVRFALDPAAAAAESEPNDLARPQELATAGFVDGRIDRPGDQDVFRVTGRAGETLVAETWARRLNSPVDTTLELLDAAGRRLAGNDDHEDKPGNLSTHHADSYLRATLPADGTYLVRVADAQRNGGPDHAYRLRIGPPRPNFELRVVPASINARSGMPTPITVYALRHDGFDGEIELGLVGAPRGFALSGGRIAPGQDKVTLTLTATAQPGEEPVRLQLGGRATIDGKPVTHLAIPAEDLMQAFFYRHLVPARDLMVNISGRASANTRVLTAGIVRLSPGGSTRVSVAVPAARTAQRVRVELLDPPPGITVADVAVIKDTLDIKLTTDAATLKPGTAGNLIFHVFNERDARPGDKAAKRPQRLYLATLPAVPFEVSALPVRVPGVTAQVR